ncbi:hypothetical protein BCON_0022g00150 [Botryotinia convoluta]|uniref:Uncharacterized protein n=1 Tax=Botryotinia convoluta TaxID=54673 RepID=A0A4Z1IZM2_9HELO|nr:hypothetical protein BCON_0022g00150 [Botryotinia convoluta]
MADQKMIQRCQLSSAANCFLNSHRENDDAESISMNHPTAPYYDGHNWKSALSVATELEHHRISGGLNYRRIVTQMDDSVKRIGLGYKKAKKVDPTPKAQELVQRGSVRAGAVPAHLQTPFVLNPTPNRVSEWPSRFENSHLSEHTGRLGLPVDHDHGDMHQSGLYLGIIRVSADKKGRKDQRFSAEDYRDSMSQYIPNPNSPGGNGQLLNAMSIYLWDKVPKTMAEIHYEISKGTEEEKKKKKKAENRLSKLENIFRRNQLKRKRIVAADNSAKKAQKMATLHREFKKSEFLREKIEQFEYIKGRGGEGYLEISHHLSAVPGYMTHEFRTERLLGTGLWNGNGPGNGVKRERPGSVWRYHDPYGVHSSLRIVSNDSSGFQEKYVTKANYGPPTSIHTVDGSAEPLKQESDPEDIESDEIESDKTEPDETEPDETESDETYFETDSDGWEIEEDESVED